MVETDIGYFGDERLKKMVLCCWHEFASDRRFVCAGSETTVPKGSDFDDF